MSDDLEYRREDVVFSAQAGLGQVDENSELDDGSELLRSMKAFVDCQPIPDDDGRLYVRELKSRIKAGEALIRRYEMINNERERFSLILPLFTLTLDSYKKKRQALDPVAQDTVPGVVMKKKRGIRSKLEKCLFPAVMIGGMIINSYLLKNVYDKTDGFSSWPSPKAPPVRRIKLSEVRNSVSDTSWKEHLASNKYDVLDSSDSKLIGRLLYVEEGESFKEKLLSDFKGYIDKYIFPQIGREKAETLVAHAANLWDSDLISRDFERILPTNIKYDPEAKKVVANMHDSEFVNIVKSWADAASGADKVKAVILKGKSVSETIAYLMHLRLPEYLEQDFIDFVRTPDGLRAFKDAVLKYDDHIWRNRVKEGTKFMVDLGSITDVFLKKVIPKRPEILIAKEKSPVVKIALKEKVVHKSPRRTKISVADYYEGGSAGDPGIFYATKIIEAGEVEIDLNGLDMCLTGILEHLILLSLDGDKDRESVYSYLVNNGRWLSDVLLKKPYFNEKANTLLINKSIIGSLAKEAKMRAEGEKTLPSSEFFGKVSDYIKRKIPDEVEEAIIPEKKGFLGRAASKVKSFFGKKNQPAAPDAPKQNFAKVYIPEGVNPREFLDKVIKFSIPDKDLASMRGTQEYYRVMKAKQKIEQIKNQASPGNFVDVPLYDEVRVANVA